MTFFAPTADRIPSQNVEVCCSGCDAVYRLSTLRDLDKEILFRWTAHKHDLDEMQAVEFLERLIESFPNTRNQLIRGKIDEKCRELDWAMLRLRCARNTAIDNDAYRAHRQRLEERVASLELEIAAMDSYRASASEADEEKIRQLLEDKPEVLRWLHGLFRLQDVKERLIQRLAAPVADDRITCRECGRGWVYITRPYYDAIY